MDNGGKNSLKSQLNIPNLLRDHRLATADLINNWKYQLHIDSILAAMFSKHAESYEKPLHTPEPLIAHLLNPNYPQVMIRDENNFTECYDRIR